MAATTGSFAIVFSFMFASFGIPVGIPPVEDAKINRMAPDECLYFLSWAGSKEANPEISNRTERLVAAFSKALDQLQATTREAISSKELVGPLKDKKLMTDFLKIAELSFSKHTTLYLRQATIKSFGDVRGGIIVSMGDKSKEAAAILTRVTQHFGPAVQSVTIGGKKLSQVRGRLGMFPDFTWGMIDNYLVFAVGKGEVEDILRRSKTGMPAWLQQVRTRLSIPQIATVTYINGKGAMKLVNELNNPLLTKHLRGFGVDELQSFALVTGLEGDGYVERALMQMPKNRKGIWTIFDNKPLTPADLKVIPYDTQVALAGRLDLAKAMATAEKLFAKTEPALATQIGFSKLGFETLLGFRIQQDILASLGDKWYLFNVPNNGSLLTSWTVATELRDRAKIVTLQKRLLDMAERAKLTIRKSKIAGHDVYCLIHRDALGLFPSWCVTKTHLVVGMYPQTIMSFLARDGKKSLADRPEVAAMLKKNAGTSFINFNESKSLAQWVYPAALMGWQYAAGELAEDANLNIAALPSVNTLTRNLRPQVVTMSSQADGLEWRSQQTLPSASIGTSLPIAGGLAVPAMVAARTAARRATSNNRLKQIGIALHNFHATYRALPAAYTINQQDKPLLSWRVMILPYLGENELYRRFKLDEPWDSPHNKKLIPLIPVAYRSPASKLPAMTGRTNYLGFSVKNGVLAKPKQSQRGKKIALGVRFADITDGTTNTIMVVEASDQMGKFWTKPDDFVPMKNDWRKGLFGLYERGANCVMCDGQTRFLDRGIEDPVLRGLVLRNE